MDLSASTFSIDSMLERNFSKIMIERQKFDGNSLSLKLKSPFNSLQLMVYHDHLKVSLDWYCIIIHCKANKYYLTGKMNISCLIELVVWILYIELFGVISCLLAYCKEVGSYLCQIKSTQGPPSLRKACTKVFQFYSKVLSLLDGFPFLIDKISRWIIFLGLLSDWWNWKLTF